MMTASESPVRCWSCGADSRAAHFCEACGKIQPVGPHSTDFFALLGLEPVLGLDREHLRKQFYELSRRFHPDRFYNLSEPEQAYSLERTALLNRAYQTLRDPIARVGYLLKTFGMDDNGAADAVSKPPPALLVELMELQESVEHWQALGDPDKRAQAAEPIRRTVRALHERETELQTQLEALFEAWDTRPAERDQTAEHLQALLDERNYLARALKTIDETLD